MDEVTKIVKDSKEEVKTSNNSMGYILQQKVKTYQDNSQYKEEIEKLVGKSKFSREDLCKFLNVKVKPLNLSESIVNAVLNFHWGQYPSLHLDELIDKGIMECKSLYYLGLTKTDADLELEDYSVIYEFWHLVYAIMSGKNLSSVIDSFLELGGVDVLDSVSNKSGTFFKSISEDFRTVD